MLTADESGCDYRIKRQQLKTYKAPISRFTKPPLFEGALHDCFLSIQGQWKIRDKEGRGGHKHFSRAIIFPTGDPAACSPWRFREIFTLINHFIGAVPVQTDRLRTLLYEDKVSGKNFTVCCGIKKTWMNVVDCKKERIIILKTENNSLVHTVLYKVDQDSVVPILIKVVQFATVFHFPLQLNFIKGLLVCSERLLLLVDSRCCNNLST